MLKVKFFLFIQLYNTEKIMSTKGFLHWLLKNLKKNVIIPLYENEGRNDLYG